MLLSLSVISSTFVNHCPFRILFIMETVITMFRKSTLRSAIVIRSPVRVIHFFYVQELSYLEPNVNKCNTCSNLYEKYFEHFQLIFPLPLISPEYSSIGHFAQCFRHLSKLMGTHNTDHHKTFMALVSLCFLQCCLSIHFFKPLECLWKRFMQQNITFLVHLFSSQHFQMWWSNNP